MGVIQDVGGIGAVADAAKSILGMIFPDKTQEERDKIALAMVQINNLQAQVMGQLEIDKAEAQSSDPLQHWRGGLGWVCTAAYAYNFVIEPLIVMLTAVAGHPIALKALDIEPLAALTLGMLGLGGLHVAERVKGAS